MLLLCQGGARFQGVEDDACELSFEAAECFASALPLALLALEVSASGWLDARLRDRDSVQGAVELAVAAAVEPVAPVLPELASSGATPAWRASCASVSKRSIARSRRADWSLVRIQAGPLRKPRLASRFVPAACSHERDAITLILECRLKRHPAALFAHGCVQDVVA